MTTYFDTVQPCCDGESGQAEHLDIVFEFAHEIKIPKQN